MNLSYPSSTSYVAIPQPYLTLLCASTSKQASLGRCHVDLVGPHIPADNATDGSQYVLDGGALVQSIQGSHGSTYRNICHQYVRKKYGKAVVVFHGYESNNTKDMTHHRWTTGKIGTSVICTADVTVTMQKKHYLANKQNKQ